MTPSEFHDWMGGHRAASKQVREWFVGMKRDEKQRVWLEWEAALRPLSKAQAVKATQLMVNSFEIREIPPAQHPRRILELAATINDPTAERRKAQQQQIEARQRREALAQLEERYGAELDGMAIEEVHQLVRTLLPVARREALVKMLGMVGRRSRMIRPTLLRQMEERDTPAEPVAPRSREEHAAVRGGIFGDLPPRPNFETKTNDQYDRE